MVVIAIIAILATIVVPKIGRKPNAVRKEFFSALRSLVRYAWHHAMTTRSLHKVNFDFAKKKVEITQATGQTKDGQPQFNALKKTGQKSSISIPSSITFKQFLVEGTDQLAQGPGQKTTAVFFYIVPNGLSQPVIINGFDTKDQINNKPRPFSLVLNPFNAQFKEYDTFQK